MSALAQTDDDLLVSQPDQGTIFLSRRSELRLIKTPRYPILGQAGQKVGEHPGEAVVFREGRFYCPADGKVELEDGRAADASEIRAWLVNHRLLGNIYEGFWAVETKAPPVSREELDRIVNATIQWDLATLERILEQERSGWEREDIVQVAEGAITRIHAMEAKLRDEAAGEADERVQEAERELEDVRRQLAEAQAGTAQPEELKPAARTQQRKRA